LACRAVNATAQRMGFTCKFGIRVIFISEFESRIKSGIFEPALP